MEENTSSQFPPANNFGQKKKIYCELVKKALNNGIFWAALTKTTVGGEVIDLAKFSPSKGKKILAATNQPLVFSLKRDNFSSQSLPPFDYAALVLAKALADKYKGPLYLQAELSVDPVEYGHTWLKEINLVKKQLKNCRRAGFYNFLLKIKVKKPALTEEIKDNLNRLVVFLDKKGQKKPRWLIDKNLTTCIKYA